MAWPDRLHGRGLGLALVGQTVSRLGGAVTVEREPEHGGAVFTVHIPVHDEVPVQ